ncbi:MAG: glycerophosphodiester phosphodiesterase [Ilumatobacteraceae bacterium]|nr:glycerophosphodiester phosphodiesterase [Ilumatobacteraceae bacterium]
MQQRLPSLLNEPILFAHRGASAYSPENTLESFALALKLGSTGLESDIWATRDGVLVLDHDGVVKSRLRSKPIAEFNRSALPSHIPSLEQLLQHCGTQYQLSLDVKDPVVFETIENTVANIDESMLERMWLCHPSSELLMSKRDSILHCKLVDSTRLAKIKEGPERRAANLASSGIEACNMHHTDWNGGLVALFHRFNIVSFGWDMQHESVLENAIRMGLDGVFSDWPDRMIEASKKPS